MYAFRTDLRNVLDCATQSESSTPSDFPVLVHSLKDCIEDIAEWMCDSTLKMNHDKTELIAIGTKPKISQVTLSPYLATTYLSLSLLEILVPL